MMNHKIVSSPPKQPQPLFDENNIIKYTPLKICFFGVSLYNMELFTKLLQWQVLKIHIKYDRIQTKGGISVKILVVDDDVNICELLRLYLVKEGWEVLVSYNGIKAMELFKTENPDFVLLDIMLPGDDGFTILKNIRTVSNIPVIMLTAKGEVNDKIAGLDIGADDYVCKPFNPKELIARIKAVSRRSDEVTTEGGVVEYENLKVDILNYELLVNGSQVEAPPKEIELLYCLATNPNKVFTRDQLLNKVWGFEFYGDTRTVDVHVKRIRSKIDGASDKWELKTVWGVGYKFEAANAK